MKIFGIEFGKKSGDFQTAGSNRGGWLRILDWRPGSFQQEDLSLDSEEGAKVITSAVVYACLRQICWDISKLPVCVKRLVNDIWQPDTHQTLIPLLRKPNGYQTWIDFLQSWLSSWLIAGNAYIVLGRVNGVVKEMHVLDPAAVTVLISSDTGAVFYQVAQDDGLVGIEGEEATFKAADIIHHRYMALGHPLIGSSVLQRAALAARMRTGIIQTGTDMAENGAVPPGILKAPEGMTEAQLEKLAENWHGRKKGRIAVVDAAFSFESLAAKYIDSQAKEFADLSAADICTAFNMPAWKVGVGTRPAGFDVEAQQIIYYQDCLQLPLEHIQALLDVGLALERDVSIEFEVEALTTLDSKTRAEVDAKEVGSAIITPNEARARRNLPPKKGGEHLWLQQQNYSLEALAARDAAGPPPSAGPSSPGAGNGGGPAAPGQDPAADSTEADVEALLDRASLPYAGVWNADLTYQAGCFATHKGSLWAAKIHARGIEPGTSTSTWQLAVKRGEADHLEAK